MRKDPTFSRRLDWLRAENALAAAESARRRAGHLILDLTESNPTTVGLELEDGGPMLAAAFRRAAGAPYQPTPRGDRRARQAIATHCWSAGALAGGAGPGAGPGGQAGGGGLEDRDRLADRLLLTTSSSESYAFLWKLLCDPGDTVLVPEPSYPLFEYLARLEGVTTVPYRLAHDGTRTGEWHLDLESVDQALAVARGRVAALVLVSPNNPTGSVVDAEQVSALEARAAAHGFALVADEVFSDYRETGALAAPSQIPFLAARPTTGLTFSLGGLSKSCGFPQLKLGWIAVGGPDALAEQALARLELIADTYLSVGTAVQLVVPQLLEVGARRRAAIAARLVENRRCLVHLVEGPSALSLLRSQGGWCAILRVPAVLGEEEWALTLLEEDAVLVHPGYFFDLRGATYLVLSLLPAPATFRMGVQKLVARVATLVG